MPAFQGSLAAKLQAWDLNSLRQPDSVSLQTKMQRIRVSIGWEGNSSEGNDFAEAAGSDAMKSINQGKKQTAHQETGLWK